MNAEDRAYAAHVGREVKRAILALLASEELWLKVQTDRHGHIRPVQMGSTRTLTNEEPEEQTK